MYLFCRTMKGGEGDARAVLSCKLLCKLNRNIKKNPTSWSKFLDTEVLVFNCVLTERVERVLVLNKRLKRGALEQKMTRNFAKTWADPGEGGGLDG